MTTTQQHTVRSYDTELEEVTRDILAMGGLVEAQLRSALDALVERDHELAQRIVETDQQIDDLERQVDELATRILALRQPMAEDLRRVKTALKVASNLERMGDLASNIAKRSLTIESDSDIPQREGLKRMGAAVYAMTNDVLNAYRDENKELALSVWHQDEAIDEMYNAVFHGILTDMMADPSTIAAGTQVHFVAKNIERMGDHTTNIAEMITYMTEGTLPDQDRPKGSTVPQGAPDDN
ncbi:MAG: phosphate signaling complex protein PhoU [Pseudomonadota bacterium]